MYEQNASYSLRIRVKKFKQNLRENYSKSSRIAITQHVNFQIFSGKAYHPTVDQTVLPPQHIEDSFETKKKASAVFVDLTAAYDTVWHRGLTCKLLRLLPDKHMVQMIMELIRNRSFTLSIGDSNRSRLRRLRNGLPQRSFLAPLLFNIYTYDLPSTIFQKYAYADDLAWMHTSKDWKTLEGTLSQDMTALSAYLQTWRLKLSHTKTVTTAFQLNNRETKSELKIFNNGKLLPYCPTQTYLGVKLDWSLTFRHHLEALRKQLPTRVTQLRRLAGSGWGAGAKTLRTATLSLVYSTAEYCAPVWCRSAHTRLIDNVLNDALRIVTGCLRPTPKDYLPILAGIQPAELRRRGATLSLANRATITLIIFYMSSWPGNKMRTRESSNQDARLYPLHSNYWIV